MIITRTRRWRIPRAIPPPRPALIGCTTLLCGDSRELLKSLASNSIDGSVTDPPYALVSIVKRFGNPDNAPAKGNQAFVRASAGFMGQRWDTGDAAHDVEFWREVFRVLKPGAFLLAFGATRTYHRLACAIEDSGFEIRDMVQWLYGSPTLRPAFSAAVAFASGGAATRPFKGALHFLAVPVLLSCLACPKFVPMQR
jgi:DNA modification methylase